MGTRLTVKGSRESFVVKSGTFIKRGGFRKHGYSRILIYFLGPRGPLVLPSVGPFVRPARKIWITYIQAYMPYES